MELDGRSDEKRAYIIDDDETFRNSMLFLLQTAGWSVRGFEDIQQFIDDRDELGTGVVLLDVRMPGIGGLDFLEGEEGALSGFAVIVVTGHGDVDTAVRCLKAGAIDFIEKPFPGKDLVRMLESSYAGLLDRVSHSRQEDEARIKVTKLSARELDVLRGLIAGESYKIAAANLGISARTVEMYRNNLAKKLGVRTTAEAVRLGALAGVSPAKAGGR